MEYKQAKRRFNSWLQRKGAYERYKRNRHITNNSRPSCWGYRSHFHSPADFISLAFDWGNTPEGDQFWSDLHIKWLRLWRDLYSHKRK